MKARCIQLGIIVWKSILSSVKGVSGHPINYNTYNSITEGSCWDNFLYTGHEISSKLNGVTQGWMVYDKTHVYVYIFVLEFKRRGSR